MGLDFSYLLYFKRKHLWDALQAVVDIAAPHQPPTRILFPDHELSIPMETWSRNNGVLNFLDPTLDFSTSLYFSEDEAIRNYLRLQREGAFHPPSGEFADRRVPIGFVYLKIHTVLAQRMTQTRDKDLVLFDFGTPGTSMSLLFVESTSIRTTFVSLLEKVPGVCGVFNQEELGKLFWLNGQGYPDLEMEKPYSAPDEIEVLLGL